MSSTLRFYTGPYQNGANLRVHVVGASQSTPLSGADFTRIDLTDGGYADLSPNTWVDIPINNSALSWIVKGGQTRLALIHDLDLRNIQPSAANNSVVSMSEDTSYQPRLTVSYMTP